MAAKKTAKKITESAPNETEATAKPVAKKAAKKAAVKKVAAETSTEPETPLKKSVVKPSLDAIARAAYLNYRRRVEQGLPGDSHGDWLEAEHQFSELS